MNWTAVGALGELLGAVAVVASLLYVANQVKHNTRTAQAEAFRAVQLKFVDLMGLWTQDGEWAEQFIQLRFQGLRRDTLSPPERAVMGMRLQALIALYASIYRDVELGVLPPAAYDVQPEGGVFASPYVRDIWPVARLEHSEDFARFFEARFGIDGAASQSLERIPPGSKVS